MKNYAIILGAGSGNRFGSFKQVEKINKTTTQDIASETGKIATDPKAIAQTGTAQKASVPDAGTSNTSSNVRPTSTNLDFCVLIATNKKLIAHKYKVFLNDLL